MPFPTQKAPDPPPLPWPADWLERSDPGDYAACRELWLEVLRACLLDCYGASPKVNRERRRLAAGHGWIRSAGFHQVCALAGLDGSAVADRLEALEASGEIDERIKTLWGSSNGKGHLG